MSAGTATFSDHNATLPRDARHEITSSVRDYFALLKPGVMSLVVFSGLAGMVLAPGEIHPFLWFITILCISAGSGAGAAINMWFDRDIDAIMQRTRYRPIPGGRVSPEDALSFGLFLAALSVMTLGTATNWIAGGLLAFAIFFYAVIYTMWLKRSTPQNIVIGGAAGAFPPVIGWAAISGDVTLFPILLFLIIFLWTPPHFWALALTKSEDYARVGVPMMPVVQGDKSTKMQMVFYSAALCLVSLLPAFLNYAGLFYTICATLLGYFFMRYAILVANDLFKQYCMRMFGFSIFYLFALFLCLMLDLVISPHLLSYIDQFLNQ